MSSSSSKSSAHSFRDASHTSSTPSRMCHHNIPADFLTSMTDLHPARRFFRCHLRKHDDCHFFEWFDSDMPSFQRGYFLSMKAQRDSLQEPVRCKAEMEKLLNDKLANVGSKVEELSLLNANLEKKVEELLLMKAQLIDKNRTLKTRLKRANYVSKVMLALLCMKICVLAWAYYAGGREMMKQHLMLS